MTGPPRYLLRAGCCGGHCGVDIFVVFRCGVDKFWYISMFFGVGWTKKIPEVAKEVTGDVVGLQKY